MTMNVCPFSQIVGVDVSKATLDFALADGKNSVSIKNTERQIVRKLIGAITDRPSTLVVLEPVFEEGINDARLQNRKLGS